MQSMSSAKRNDGAIQCRKGDFCTSNGAANHAKESTSGRKRLSRGWYYPYAFPDVIEPAVAIAYEDATSPDAQAEIAAISQLNQIGVGPRLLDVGGLGGLDTWAAGKPVFVEEDVGETLDRLLFEGAVIPGVAGGPGVSLQPLGSEERALQNDKIMFDVLCQIANMHTADWYHWDIKSSNICVRSFGKRPQDLRATIIDVEGDQGFKPTGLLHVTPRYFDTLFTQLPSLVAGQPMEVTPTALQCDMGCLEAVRFELTHGESLVYYGSNGAAAYNLTPNYLRQRKNPLFCYREDGTPVARRIDRRTDLVPLAERLGLIPLDKAHIFDPYLLSYARTHFRHGGFLDTYDLRLLHRRYPTAVVSATDKLAYAVFANYKRHRIEDGLAVDYGSFESQPAHLRASCVAQAQSIPGKVYALGYRIVPSENIGDDEVVTELVDEEVEWLAQLEHRRWVDERRHAGWVYGPERNASAKPPTSPYLVPWDQLTEEVKDYNRQPMREIVYLLNSVGLTLVR